jgi:hypothetical protein
LVLKSSESRIISGLKSGLLLLGSGCTSTNRNRLSSGKISISVNEYPGSPSTFSLKCELSPPPNRMEVRMLSLLGLYTSICLFTDSGVLVATLVNTVSNQSVSVFTITDSVVVKDSFLQAENAI